VRGGKPSDASTFREFGKTFHHVFEANSHAPGGWIEMIDAAADFGQVGKSRRSEDYAQDGARRSPGVPQVSSQSVTSLNR